MLIHPNFNPIALQIGKIKIYWYGIMYLLSFWIIAKLAEKRVEQEGGNKKIIDLSLNFALLGVLLGGRLGYILFYGRELAFWKIWEGGMSFHGGLIGVMLGLAWVSYRYKTSWLALTDFWAPLVPIGLALGRLGNFINGELYGRITTVAWGMVYPLVDLLIRHPSQIYEFLTEGVGLFLVLNWVRKFSLRKGVRSGIFLIGYGVSRVICECFREPDLQIGYLGSYFTMGQLLTVPFFLLGFYLVMRGKDE